MSGMRVALCSGMKNGTQALVKQLDHLRDHLASDMANLASTTGSLVATKASGAKDLVVDRGGDLVVALSFGVGYLAMRFVPLLGRRSTDANAD